MTRQANGPEPSWEDRNNAYLAAELEGLRARLIPLARVAQRDIEPRSATSSYVELLPATRPVEPPRRRWLWPWSRNATQTVANPGGAESSVADPRHAELRKQAEVDITREQLANL